VKDGTEGASSLAWGSRKLVLPSPFREEDWSSSGEIGFALIEEIEELQTLAGRSRRETWHRGPTWEAPVGLSNCLTITCNSKTRGTGKRRGGGGQQGTVRGLTFALSSVLNRTLDREITGNVDQEGKLGGHGVLDPFHEKTSDLSTLTPAQADGRGIQGGQEL